MVKQWEYDPVFLQVSKEAQKVGRIIVGESKSFMVYQFAQQAKYLPGDVAELGAFCGATSRVIAEAIKGANKTIRLFDTFEGLPEPNKSIDLCRKGQFTANFEVIKNFLKDYSNIVFHKGLFPRTAEGLEDNTYSFVHIDVDLYQSTLDGMKYFYPRMCKGGTILLDDYRFPHAPGVIKAVTEFMIDKPERVIVSSLDHQAFIIKI